MSKLFNYKPHILLIIPLALSSFLTINQLHNKSFWLDEAFSIYISRDLSYLINSFVHTESNMLLYYLLLHFWLYLGDSEFMVRLLSIIPAVFSIPVIYLLGKKLFNSRVGLIAALLLSVNGFFVEYAQEARAYSLLLFMVSMASYLLLEYLDKHNIKILFLYFIICILAILTHFFAFFIVFSHLIFLLVFHRRSIFSKQFILLSLPFGLLMMSILFLPSFVHQGSHNWVNKFKFTDLGILFSKLSGGEYTSELSFLLFVVFVFIFFIKRKSVKNSIFFVVLTLFLPIVITVIISKFVKPSFIIRYLIICLPFFVLIESYLISLINNKKILAFSLIVFFIFSLLNGKELYGYKKESWREVAQYISPKYESKDIIILHPYYIKIPLEYYLEKTPNHLERGYYVSELTFYDYKNGLATSLPQLNLSLIKNIEAERIWFISRVDQTPINALQKKSITDEINKRFKLYNEENFHAIQVSLYKRVNYE